LCSLLFSAKCSEGKRADHRKAKLKNQPSQSAGLFYCARITNRAGGIPND